MEIQTQVATYSAPNVVLVKPITFQSDTGQPVSLQPGLMLLVDLSDMCFLWHGEYIDIQPDEFRLVN